MTTSIHIKNMVCPRCIRVVREELRNLGLNVKNVTLGEAEIEDYLTSETTQKIKLVLENNGFELLEDQKRKIVERMKIAIIDLLYNDDNNSRAHRITLSAYLADKLKMDYNYLSTLFSSVENITIEKYVILQKVERVKELLKYEQLTISEIAYRLHYSSTQHLSNQFRQITGMTPTQFKKMVRNNRKPIDQLT